MASGPVNDATPVSYGPLGLPHPHAACLLGPQRDSILSDTSIYCDVRKRHGPNDVMTLSMHGPVAADFEKARQRAISYVESNFEEGVRNHNDALAKGLLAPHYGGGGGQSKTRQVQCSSFLNDVEFYSEMQHAREKDNKKVKA